MYFKLAMRNVKKSFKEYLIYFLTLAFSVCLFYTFNSFQDQQAVLEMSSAQADIIDSLQGLMEILSVVVALILAFLIKYANSFLIKRRKKEFGLYTLLGMPKAMITRILVYETFIIGMISLLTGIAAGLFLSQCLTVLTANLFDVALNYHFIYSQGATNLTIMSFAIIFFIVMFFNAFSLNRFKLIDLLTADRKNEDLKIKNIYVSVIVFVISIVLLGIAYWRAFYGGAMAFLELPLIAPCGIIGTILFFMSLSGFLIKFVQCSKSLYYKRLNMFVLRQINSSINSNFLSMSVVCIMLLFSIGALATGANLNKTINNTIELTTPYDYTYTNYQKDNSDGIRQIKEDLGIDTSLIKEDFFVDVYNSDIKVRTFEEYTKVQSELSYQLDYPLEILPLSSFNKLRSDKGLEPMQLATDEAYLLTSAEMMRDMIYGALFEAKPEFDLYGTHMKMINDDCELINMGTTTATGTFMFGFVVNDEIIPSDATINSTYWNVNLNDATQITPFSEAMVKAIEESFETNITNEGTTYELGYNAGYSDDRNNVYEVSKGLSVVITYIGIYLGIVFLIASAVILALQQLSQASDSRQRYQILNKIGAEKRMVYNSVLFQLCIYFFMPLLLGVVHSIAGIYVVNSVVVAMGAGDLFNASIITGGILLLIYGSYFLITYYGYRRIITQP